MIVWVIIGLVGTAAIVRLVLFDPRRRCAWCGQRTADAVRWGAGHVCTDCATRHQAPDLRPPRGHR